MKILALADLHLHEWPGFAPVDRLGDQRGVLEQIVMLARERSVDAVLIAGDLFHRPHPTPRVLAAFREFAVALARDSDIPVLAICGNASHDIVSADEYAALELFDDLIDVRRVPGLWHGPGVTVACLPSVPVSNYVALVGGGDRDEVNANVADHLITIARVMRAEIPAGPAAVLCGHWSVSGAALPNGLPADRAREPILPLSALELLGFDAVVLGHIHRPQPLGTLAPDDELMPIFYVGSPMPLDFGEAGFGHGVWIVDLEAGSGLAEFVEIESRPFLTADVSIDDAHGSSLDCDYDVSEAIVRVRYTATQEQARHIDNAALRRDLLDAGAARVIVQPDIVREDRARVEGLDEGLSELDAVDLYVAAQNLEPGRGEQLRDLTQMYLEQVRA